MTEILDCSDNKRVDLLKVDIDGAGGELYLHASLSGWPVWKRLPSSSTRLACARGSDDQMTRNGLGICSEPLPHR